MPNKIIVENRTLRDISFTRATLADAVVGGSHLEDLTFRGCRIIGCNLRASYIRNARFERCNFEHCDVFGAHINYARFDSCTLNGCSIHDVYAQHIIFSYCTLVDVAFIASFLKGADFRDSTHFEKVLWSECKLSARFKDCTFDRVEALGTDLTGCDFVNSDPSGIKYDYLTRGLHPAPEGDLIGWGVKGGNLVKLRIPAEARRSWATTRKLRAEYADVLWIEGDLKEVRHRTPLDEYVYYRVGERIYPDAFDENRWNECSSGIHFFLTPEEADAWAWS